MCSVTVIIRLLCRKAKCFDTVQNRLWRDGEAAYGQVVRKDFLSKAELNEVFLTGGKEAEAEFRQDLTVSPAILGLLDGKYWSLSFCWVKSMIRPLC